MNDKDKWKTYPCKTCIVKSTCKQECFNWHNINIEKYIKENQLEGICLNCGIKVINNLIWCDTCIRRTVLSKPW